MLSSGKPKRVVSQAPLKPTLCAADCGATVFYRTSSKIVCPACRPLRSIQKNRRAAEHRRRKHGVSKVKGTEVHCARCNASFIRAGIRRKYCKPCAPKAALERRYERWSKNPGLRVNALIANAIGLSLRGRKAGRTWESLVGYTLADLMRHLERQFIDGMSWANFGEWEIDHRRPLASFTFTSPGDAEFSAAWALTNLSPLWRSENRRKKDRRTLLL